MEEPLEFGRSDAGYSWLAPADLTAENRKAEKRADPVAVENMRGFAAEDMRQQEFPQ